jgi:hypothetical protein
MPGMPEKLINKSRPRPIYIQSRQASLFKNSCGPRLQCEHARHVERVAGARRWRGLSVHAAERGRKRS